LGATVSAVADPEFSRRDRIVAAEDLPGVPEGTPGTVIQVTGLSWIRYRVDFDNGVKRNLIDGRYLSRVPTKKKARE
jgi:hypothetical protein